LKEDRTRNLIAIACRRSTTIAATACVPLLAMIRISLRIALTRLTLAVHRLRTILTRRPRRFTLAVNGG
jgi:hypothetical protein